MLKTTFLLASVVGLILFGCNQKESTEFVNKAAYDLAIGDEVRIYYSVNSCCQYCILNLDSLQHVSLVGDVVVEDYPDDCAGCNATYAFVFKALSSGTDTVYLNMREASASCYELNREPEKFVIHVK
jgi:hypothetical protein